MTSPSTNIDDELFNLCKEVYDETGWRDTDSLFTSDGSSVYENAFRNSILSGGDSVPLYTSDYLLEKLPLVILEDTSDRQQVPMVLTLWINGNKEARVAYLIPYDEDNRGSHQQSADTPLKAFLKLTIALADAGELGGKK